METPVSPSSDKESITGKERRSIAQRVTIVGSIGDALLGFLKIFIGLGFHSRALVIDGIHSFTDVLTDIFVIVITRVAHEGPDKGHPYGHEKFETIGSAALGSILIGTGGALIYDTGKTLFLEEELLKPGWPTVAAAAISLLVKEGLFHYQYKAGKKIDSKMIMANAWHSRTDALSSLVVLIGLIFGIIGYPWVDKLAAMAVSLMIAHIGWRFVKESLQELADTSADPKLIERIREVILNSEGVKSCHALRTRKMGPKVLLDVNVEVHSRITASEGHEISSWVVKNLKEKIKEVEDVTVHLDVEDDRDSDHDNPFAHSFEDLLPLRNEVLKKLNEVWSGMDIHPDKRHDHVIKLHYLKGKIQPEIHVTYRWWKDSSYDEISALEKDLNELASSLEWFKEARILIKSS